MQLNEPATTRRRNAFLLAKLEYQQELEEFQRRNKEIKSSNVGGEVVQTLDDDDGKIGQTIVYNDSADMNIEDNMDDQ